MVNDLPDTLTKHSPMVGLVSAFILVAFFINPVHAEDGTGFPIVRGETLEMVMGRRTVIATYVGLDQYGHHMALTFDDGPYAGVYWLGRKTMDIVRLRTRKGVTREYENVERSGLMAGGPGTSWELDYTYAGIRRTGNCEASDVQGGYYTITCNDQRTDRNFGIDRETVVHAPSGMWIERRKVNQYNNNRSAVILSPESIAKLAR